MPDVELRQQIRAARGCFVAMLVTYCLGVFNDSLFRESSMLLAQERGLTTLHGLIMTIFALPYVLFAGYCGWLADRFSKRHVMIGAKLLELAAMICGAAGMLFMHWPAVVAMVFLMGTHSAIFSPSMNGSIPELYPAEYVTTANAFVKVFVTATILLGVAASGPLLHYEFPSIGGVPLGRAIVACTVVAIAAAGVVSSFALPRLPAADPKKPFPWRGPLHTIGDLRRISKDRLLAVTIAADTFIWFVGALFVPIINKLGIDRFASKRTASLLIASEMIGVAVGGYLASRFARGRRWYRVLPPAALAMTVLMLATSAVSRLPASWHLAALFVLVGLTGIAGGMFMIPCEAFFQTRPPQERKGSVIASANCASFIGVLLSGIVAIGLNHWLMPLHSFAVVAVLSAAVGAWLTWALPRADRAGSNDSEEPLAVEEPGE
ncbi:MAG TPA: MFS transporter [Phycisphaerae bacterium]|nr:MFS transporter [Phycisphaerae bacterium]